jgi:post-segregation antitoxin (ccd killing protein)
MGMVRKALNLLVDEDLVDKARNHGLNLSKFFENQLRGYFNFI